jgi:hypothetical protein
MATAFSQITLGFAMRKKYGMQSTSAYTSKQKRQTNHINESGKSHARAEQIAKLVLSFYQNCKINIV